MKRNLDTALAGQWDLASERAVVSAESTETCHNVEDYAAPAVLRIKEHSTY
jgi:hypothetical protein